MISFTDPLLQKCFDRSLREADEGTEAEGQVRALVATYEVMRMFEGGHSARVHETIEKLLSPELQPALGRWLRQRGKEDSSDLEELRRQLGDLGETKAGAPPKRSNP